MKVSDLLPERLDGLGEAAREALCRDQQVGGMKLAWDYVSRRLDEALRSALDCDLMEVLAQGWANSRLMGGYAAAATSAEPTEVELGEHEVSRELNPVVAVTIGPCPCVELEFNVALSARFGGLKLEIADRHITGGRPGEVWAGAAVSFRDLTLCEAESRRLQLPGEFRFAAPGVPIPLAAG